ncbi:universal stress protein [Phototrophicus methaneseepsis]|uniref:Universal stress protein n=1 Tax=Phototrophicus methaneseepsis TaxID=2710758 RepID=A0A7S8EDC1_9CHLR|nr:universal stress protein [Phototrophicus methaneseepsis]QPC84888.1 universal stress protein [Phototrophicus methaneseepsis]
MLKHVLVTLDGSELSEQALQYAENLVTPDGKLTLLSVVDVPDMQVYSMYDLPLIVQEMDYDHFVNKVESSMREYLNGIVASLQRRGLQAVPLVTTGDPAKMIIEQAEKLSVDTIVMCTHGRSGLSRWLFGSVTQKVLNTMPCPVLVIPGTVVKKESTRGTVESSVAGDTPANTTSAVPV